jgi:hypothetical protein
MDRKIYRELSKWKKKGGGSALRIEGAPRVGKTHTALAFGEAEYDSFLLIDFQRAGDEVRRLFRTHLSAPDALFGELGRLFNVQLFPREEPGAEARSLIIFDDISFCPKAREALPQLIADGRFDYLETASPVRDKPGRPAPLCSEETLELLPLDFEEFADAAGEAFLSDFLRRSFENRKPLGELLHRKAMDLFRTYLIVGGMPEAGNTYLESRDFYDVHRTKAGILKRLRKDLKQSPNPQREKAAALLELVPAQLARPEKRFRPSDFKKGASMKVCTPAFRLLEESGILTCAANLTDAGGRLLPDADFPSLKCFYADTGLLVSAAFGKDPYAIHKKIIFKPLEFKDGMILQNAAAQMFRSARRPLFFYLNQNAAAGSENCMKIDFLVPNKAESAETFTPVFLQLTNRTSSASLTKCLRKFGSQMTKPAVLYSGELEEREDRIMLPYYMSHLL